jgi:hypothetical protein
MVTIKPNFPLSTANVIKIHSKHLKMKLARGQLDGWVRTIYDLTSRRSFYIFHAKVNLKVSIFCRIFAIVLLSSEFF